MKNSSLVWRLCFPSVLANNDFVLLCMNSHFSAGKYDIIKFVFGISWWFLWNTVKNLFEPLPEVSRPYLQQWKTRDRKTNCLKPSLILVFGGYTSVLNNQPECIWNLLCTINRELSRHRKPMQYSPYFRNIIYLVNKHYPSVLISKTVLNWHRCSEKEVIIKV